jgi:hypothetical protein
VTIIAVDFDGTLVEHRYPGIGPDVPGAFDWCTRLQQGGALLLLWTMRDGAQLDEAVEHCRARGVQFWGVNGNPQQRSWTASPKAYAHAYIDDAAVGCPLVLPTVPGRRAFVDWSLVGPAAWALLNP